MEAGTEAIYADPAGLFTVPIPTNWTVEQNEGYATLISPERALPISNWAKGLSRIRFQV
jgi:hypothetical protein